MKRTRRSRINTTIEEMRVLINQIMRNRAVIRKTREKGTETIIKTEIKTRTTINI